jgi:putative endonuclease
MQKEGFVYILSNWRGSVLYVGVTNDLRRRVWEHKQRLDSPFTARSKVDKLVYYEAVETIEGAILREKQIKAGSRRKKVLLIVGLNPSWIDLYDRI